MGVPVLFSFFLVTAHSPIPSAFIVIDFYRGSIIIGFVRMLYVLQDGGFYLSFPEAIMCGGGDAHFYLLIDLRFSLRYQIILCFLTCYTLSAFFSFLFFFFFFFLSSPVNHNLTCNMNGQLTITYCLMF